MSESPEQHPLFTAIEMKDVLQVESLIAAGVDLNATFLFGRLPLMHACGYSSAPASFQIIELLLNAGADINARGKYCGTALGYAAQGNNPVLVQYLLDHGADVNARMEDESCAYNDSTALHWAATYSESAEIVEMLIDAGANVNAPGLMGNTPLHNAVTSSHRMLSSEALDKTGIVEVLLRRGARVNARDDSGETPLISMARVNPSIPLAELLLAQKANVNAKDHYGDTALHIAAKCGYADFVDLLLRHGADPVKENKDGMTPLQLMEAFNERAAEPGSSEAGLKGLTKIVSGDAARDFNAIAESLQQAEQAVPNERKAFRMLKHFFFGK